MTRRTDTLGHALLADLKAWQARPFLADLSPLGMPLYPIELSAALALHRAGLAVISYTPPTPGHTGAYLQPAKE